MRLHINVDHIATLRNARGTPYPDPVDAARVCLDSGAHGITAHLREDRRHIVDDDVERLRGTLRATFNLEMAATDEMVGIACKLHPDVVTLVPERREERTTEGGLDVAGGRARLAPIIARLGEAGIRVSLFVEPESAVMEAARALGAPVVELHTGAYAEAVLAGEDERVRAELARVAAAAAHGASLGLEIHAGHGLTEENVGVVAAIPEIVELNIGHALVSAAIFVGLGDAVRAMRAAMERGRTPNSVAA